LQTAYNTVRCVYSEFIVVICSIVIRIFY